MRKKLFLILFSLATYPAFSQNSSSKLMLLDTVQVSHYAVWYDKYDTGGNTSVAHDAANIYKWSGNSAYRSEGWGYFDINGIEFPYIKRDRDLGQTFKYTGSTAQELKAITVRLGFGSNVVRTGMYGKKLSVQLFEVLGNPVLNDNGSAGSMKALHGFPHNRHQADIAAIRDDYYTGETYKSIAVLSGYRFPDKAAFGFKNSDVAIPAGHPNLKGKYLQFLLPPTSSIVLQPGKQYAFLIMIDTMGQEHGFTLANEYMGAYPDGHGIRRDGNGIFPPVASNPAKDFTDPENREAFASAHFPADLKKRAAIPPGTNGYPDVDTWRDLVFFIQTK